MTDITDDMLVVFADESNVDEIAEALIVETDRVCISADDIPIDDIPFYAADRMLNRNN